MYIADSAGASLGEGNGLLILLITILSISFVGGSIAGIITLFFIRKSEFFSLIFRGLIGAIAGIEAILYADIFFLGSPPNNLNEVLKSIISFHENFLNKLFSLEGLFGAIGATIAVFLVRWAVRSRQ